jgi:hypothetical protein
MYVSFFFLLFFFVNSLLSFKRLSSSLDLHRLGPCIYLTATSLDPFIVDPESFATERNVSSLSGALRYK